MKNITIKSLVMGVLLIGLSAQMMVASEQNAEEYGTRVKASWGQLAKHAGIGLGKIATICTLIYFLKETKKEFVFDTDEIETKIGKVESYSKDVREIVRKKLNDQQNKIIEENNFKLMVTEIGIQEGSWKDKIAFERICNANPEIFFNELVCEKSGLSLMGCESLKSCFSIFRDNLAGSFRDCFALTSIFGGIVALTGLKDLYSAFKIAKAMRNKETSVKLA